MYSSFGPLKIKFISKCNLFQLFYAATTPRSGSGDSPQTQAPSPPAAQPIKVPQSIHDIDNGKILGFGADLAEGHPGFHDEEYKQRRSMIGELARSHNIGEPIPR